MTRCQHVTLIFKTGLKQLGKMVDSLRNNCIKNFFGDVFFSPTDNEFYQTLEK